MMSDEERRERIREAKAQGFTIVRRDINCGKPNCSKCPHGPYLYGYKHYPGSMDFIYLGKAS